MIMLSVIDYINIIMKRKKITRTELCKKINIIEDNAGLGERTTIQNITNYLNGYHNIRPKWLVKVEMALDLPSDTLIKMVEKPKTKNGMKELENIKSKLRNGADND